MAINVDYCNRQADRLSECASKLLSAKNTLSTNKTTLNSVWTDKSVNKINRKFDSVIKDISEAISECYTIRSNIKTAARDVRNKELKEEQK